MKFLIALLIAVPTLIAVLLFTVAACSYINPSILSATTNPAIALLCLIGGIVALLPLVLAIVIKIIGLAGSKKDADNPKKKDR